MVGQRDLWSIKASSGCHISDYSGQSLERPQYGNEVLALALELRYIRIIIEDENAEVARLEMLSQAFGYTRTRVNFDELESANPLHDVLQAWV
jgi:hypothetical protein